MDMVQWAYFILCKIDFTSKYDWVKDGQKKYNPEASSYYGVISRMKRIIFLFTNEIYNSIVICSGRDIQIAYLHDSSSEIDYIICGK